ncbi:hypothetical protein GGS20DRAFT_582475 [Poronia punctata]|nr:hypothetical protein GGS20DRAFT_582475 [Poronia punctata]
MWDIGDADRWSTDQVYKYLGQPRKVRLPKAYSNGDLVVPLKFPLDMIQPKLHLDGFDEALIADLEQPWRWPVRFPVEYCAPEQLHCERPTFASDIWSFTCLLLQVYLGIDSPWGPEHPMSNMDWWYADTIPGSLLQGWLDLRHDKHKSLEMKIDRLRRLRCRPRAKLIRERYLAARVFRMGFQYDPVLRPSAAELLEDPVFNEFIEVED